MDAIDVSIVIPVYNSAAMLPALHVRLHLSVNGKLPYRERRVLDGTDA